MNSTSNVAKASGALQTMIKVRGQWMEITKRSIKGKGILVNWPDRILAKGRPRQTPKVGT